MKRTLPLALILPVALLSLPAVGADSFQARLRGKNEVPPVSTKTKGLFKITMRNRSADFRLRVDRGKRVTQAHLHCGASGVNGPVVAFLAGFHDNGWNTKGRTASGKPVDWVRARLTNANVIETPVSGACPMKINATLASLLAAMKADYIYVNVHTIANPGGEVRGQIKPKP